MRSQQLWGIKFSTSPIQKQRIIDRYIDTVIVAAKNDNIPDVRWYRELMSENGVKHYAISATITQLCSKLELPKPLNFNWMAQLKDGKKQYNFNRSFIRFNKVGDIIYGFSCSSTEAEWNGDIPYSGFKIDINEKEVISSSMDFAQTSTEMFFRLCAFIELSEITETVVQPKGKIGTKKKEPFKNDETVPITYVTSTWANTIYVKGKLPVSGHYRMQAHGPKNSLRKLIFIHPFTKMGYTVRAGKLIEEGTQKD